MSEDAIARLATLREQRRLLLDLAEHKAFLYLNSIVQEQVDQLQHEILFNPCPGVDSAWAQEYKKGELAGKLSWCPTLQTAIDSLEVSINHLQGQLEDAPDDGREPANSAP